MKRRQFIKKSSLGIPAVLIAPQILGSGCNKEKRASKKKVIVIGAGISGLAAAKKLKETGFQVTVLEAQDKVGGRLRTNSSLGVSFDEGASWIHGVKGNPITKLAQQSGMSTFFTDDSSKKSYDIGAVVRSNSTYDTAETELYNILSTMMHHGSASKSFETVFNEQYPGKINDRLWKFLLSTYVTFDCGDLNKLSSLLYNEGEEYGGNEEIITNGYDTLAKHIAQGLDIQLQQKVTNIDYSNNKIKVTANGNLHETDYVIVTVPLGVLKANILSFNPPLPSAKTNAISKIGMNCVNKFLLTWDTAFWDEVQYISYTPEIADKFNYFVNVKKFHPNVNALMTFAYAEYARYTETATDTQITAEIMSHLRDMYGNSIPEPTNLLRTKWQSNEYTLGSYSYTAMETEMKHFEDLALEIDDKLFFAGEHTEVDYFSTVHGAYLSGIREADKIIALL